MNNLPISNSNSYKTIHYKKSIIQVANMNVDEIIASLSPDQLHSLMQTIASKKILDTVEQDAKLASIDWEKQKQTWLNDTHSIHTKRAYQKALLTYDLWLAKESINPLALTPLQADHYIRHIKNDGRAPLSLRRDIAAISAFYSFLNRYYPQITNPFKGSRLKPEQKTIKETIIPDHDTALSIINAMPSVEKAILTVCYYRGLRIGALPTLTAGKNGKYYGQSKGKDLKESKITGITLPPEALKAIENAGLNPDKPFAQWTANALERRINYRMKHLFDTGVIPTIYSPHDFRHAYASEFYRKHKDIYHLSKLLNHSSIGITETYLQGLGIEL